MNPRGLIKILLICLDVVLIGIAIYFFFFQRAPDITPLTLSTVSLRDLRAAPEKIEVKAPGETAISSKIDATRLWVIKGKDVWETEFTNEERPTTAGDTLEKVGRNGPKWGPGISVDVVVNVVNLESGKNYLLKASNQDIERTD